MVQKMSGADKPVPLWGEQDKSTHMRLRRLLFSLLLRLKVLYFFTVIVLIFFLYKCSLSN